MTTNNFISIVRYINPWKMGINFFNTEVNWKWKLTERNTRKKKQKKTCGNEKYIATQLSDNQNWFTQREVLHPPYFSKAMSHSFQTFPFFWCLVFGLIIPQIYDSVFFFYARFIYFILLHFFTFLFWHYYQKDWMPLILKIQLIWFHFFSGYCSEDEERLVRDLFRGYNKLVRPVQNMSQKVEVKFGLTFTQLISVVTIDCHLQFSFLPHQIVLIVSLMQVYNFYALVNKLIRSIILAFFCSF